MEIIFFYFSQWNLKINISQLSGKKYFEKQIWMTT